MQLTLVPIGKNKSVSSVPKVLGEFLTDDYVDLTDTRKEIIYYYGTTKVPIDFLPAGTRYDSLCVSASRGCVTIVTTDPALSLAFKFEAFKDYQVPQEKIKLAEAYAHIDMLRQTLQTVLSGTLLDAYGNRDSDGLELALLYGIDKDEIKSMATKIRAALASPRPNEVG